MHGPSITMEVLDVLSSYKLPGKFPDLEIKEQKMWDCNWWAGAKIK